MTEVEVCPFTDPPELSSLPGEIDDAARLLDRVVPQWWQRIELETLDQYWYTTKGALRTDEECSVLGQLFGSIHAGLRELNLADDSPEGWGFTMCCDSMCTDQIHDMATPLWRKQIKTRVVAEFEHQVLLFDPDTEWDVNYRKRRWLRW